MSEQEGRTHPLDFGRPVNTTYGQPGGGQILPPKLLPTHVRFFGGIPPHPAEVQFASFLSGEFTTMAVINPPERKLTKRTSVAPLWFRRPWNC